MTQEGEGGREKCLYIISKTYIYIGTEVNISAYRALRAGAGIQGREKGCDIRCKLIGCTVCPQELGVCRALGES